jgi:hypothetical protein
MLPPVRVPWALHYKNIGDLLFLPSAAEIIYRPCTPFILIVVIA